MSFQDKYLKYKAKYLALKNGGGHEDEKDEKNKKHIKWVYARENLCKVKERTIHLLSEIELMNQLKPKELPIIDILTYNVSRTSMDNSHFNCVNNNRICSSNIINVLRNNSAHFFLLQEAEDIYFADVQFLGMRKINLNNNTCITYYNNNEFTLGQHLFNGLLVDNVHGGYFMQGYPYLIAHFTRKGKDYIVINVDLPKNFGENEIIAQLRTMQFNLPNWLNEILNNINNTKILIGGDFNSDLFGFNFNDNLAERIFNRRFLREPETLKTCCDVDLNGFNLDYKDDHLLRTTNLYLWRYSSIKTGERHSNHIPMLYQIVLDDEIEYEIDPYNQIRIIRRPDIPVY
jgi:hypothetical protein